MKPYIIIRGACSKTLNGLKLVCLRNLHSVLLHFLKAGKICLFLKKSNPNWDSDQNFKHKGRKKPPKNEISFYGWEIASFLLVFLLDFWNWLCYT